MIRRPPRSTRVRSSAASDVYKRQPVSPSTKTPATAATSTVRLRSDLFWVLLISATHAWRSVSSVRSLLVIGSTLSAWWWRGRNVRNARGQGYGVAGRPAGDARYRTSTIGVAREDPRHSPHSEGDGHDEDASKDEPSAGCHLESPFWSSPPQVSGPNLIAVSYTHLTLP